MIHLRSQRPGIFALVLALAATSTALAQTASGAAPAPNVVVVRVGRLLDVRSGQYLANVAISIAGERDRLTADRPRSVDHGAAAPPIESIA